MIVVMRQTCTADDTQRVVSALKEMGATPWVNEDRAQQVVEVLGGNGHVDRDHLASLPSVERILDADAPLLTKATGEGTKSVPLGAHAQIGGTKLGIIAGPCAVENRDTLLRTAEAVQAAGASALRGGAFKPRTSPYAFQGHQEQGLKWLAEARDATGLAVVTEVMSPEQLDMVCAYADVLQVGSRNMHSSPLLKAIGQVDKPVLLKRSWGATLKEMLLAAEYVIAGGNSNVILCERGIRTHEEYVRNTLALGVVPQVKHVSNLPIVVDPSHGTGQRHLVTPMSYAAIACGADGLLIEVHPNPDQAWTDSFQTVDLDQFKSLMEGLRPFAEAAGRSL